MALGELLITHYAEADNRKYTKECKWKRRAPRGVTMRPPWGVTMRPPWGVTMSPLFVFAAYLTSHLYEWVCRSFFQQIKGRGN